MINAQPNSPTTRQWLSTHSVMILLCGALSGCAANSFDQLSADSGIANEVIQANCKQISCHYDSQAKQFNAIANDGLAIDALWSGYEDRNIEYQWSSGKNQIQVTLFDQTFSDRWPTADKVEIYVNKTLITEVAASVDRVLGNYDPTLKRSAKIITVSADIPIAAAQTIANAHYRSVAIRFYNQGTFHTIKLNQSHQLIQVVNLAKAI